MSGPAFFAQPLWPRLAAMHLHFLWQGLLIAWLYWTVVKLFAVHSARARYALGMAGLLTMPAAMAATFWLVEVPQPKDRAPATLAILSKEEHPLANPLDDSSGSARNDSFQHVQSEGPVTLTGHRPQGGSPKGRGDQNQESLSSPASKPSAKLAPTASTFQEPSQTESQNLLTPMLLGGWFLGVMIFGMRLLGGVGTVLWCRWSSLPVTDLQSLKLLERLSHQLGLARPPRLAASFQAGDAFSLGLFRPMIVLPAAWLLKLPPGVLESVLAHELAHIRRFDAWANLFQRVLEAWLFYHPAVWWLSRQMDREREKCADFWAASLTGDPLQYVKTLAVVAELQTANRPAKLVGPILATGMGGKNMVLLERVRHILGDTPRTGAASRLLAGALVLAIPAGLWVGAMMLPAKAAGDDDKLVAQADDDEDGDRERGDRERGDRDRPDARRDGDRPRGEGPRDGDRPRGEGPRDGDRPRGEGPRDGDQPPREGAGPRRPPQFPPRSRDGAGPRGPFPPGVRGFRRDGEGPREGEGPRDGDRPRGREGDFRPGPQGELLEAIRDLRREVEQLRQEVRELREARGPRPGVGPMREGGVRLELRKGEPPRIVRPEVRRPEREGERREGAEREREGERREGAEREREGERREGAEREREGERREGAEREIKGEGQRFRIEIREGGRARVSREGAEGERREGAEREGDQERLEKAREEAREKREGDREEEGDDDDGDDDENAEKPSAAAEAAFVFPRLDKNNDKTLDQEEWGASNAIRKGFQTRSIQLSFPVDFKTFLARYPRERIVPRMRLRE